MLQIVRGASSGVQLANLRSRSYGNSSRVLKMPAEIKLLRLRCSPTFLFDFRTLRIQLGYILRINLVVQLSIAFSNSLIVSYSKGVGQR